MTLRLEVRKLGVTSQDGNSSCQQHPLHYARSCFILKSPVLRDASKILSCRAVNNSILQYVNVPAPLHHFYFVDKPKVDISFH